MEGRHLVNKPHLRGINIYWKLMPDLAKYYIYSRDNNDGINTQKLLQGFQPHPNLRMLELWCYPGEWFPSLEGSLMNLETCLPNLFEIKFLGCIRLEHLPSSIYLRHLKSDLGIEKVGVRRVLVVEVE